MSESDIVAIKLLDREYQIKCPSEKIAELQEAATYLEKKMRELSEGGKIINFDRIITIAALNITHELEKLRNEKKSYIDNMSKRIQDIQNKIDQALAQ